MNSQRIDELISKIAAWERTYNETTSPVLQKKKLDILLSRLSRPEYLMPSQFTTNPSDAWTIIVSDYDSIITKIRTSLSYIILLDVYTKTFTHNRGYYSRKRKQIYEGLLAEHTERPELLYSFREAAWSYRLQPPTLQRLPLYTVLLNFLLTTQEENEW